MNNARPELSLEEQVNALCLQAIDLGMPVDAFLLIVDVACQCVMVCRSKQVIYRYPISTSRLGIGNKMNSRKTPPGFHEIVARIGDGMPIGARFVSRVFTGDVLEPDQWSKGEEDMILSRILRLSGLIPGLNQGGNVDSYEREIYVHGTNQEQYVGKEPSSGGCVRMRNRDIVQLYDVLSCGPAWCWIGALDESREATMS